MTVQTASDERVLAGPELYDQMQRDFDYGPVIWTMMRYDERQTKESSNSLLNSFLQWIALVPAIETGKTYVMLKTPVEEAFHSFVLNTRHYGAFCERFLGYFFHHDPVTEERAPQMQGGVRYTVELLEKHYGDSLLQPLREWRRQLDDGSAQIACVGCGKEDLGR
jgi:hypothetical protein